MRTSQRTELRSHTDIAILGGGPAGLQAALTAGRVGRQATLFDDGTYRNATVSHMHNVVTHDGTPPAQFRAAARAELTAYDTVCVREERVETIERDGEDFRLTLASGDVLSAYAVVLATGVRDELPPIPGLQDVWGDLAAQCPFCHAFEFKGTRIGIIGASAAGHYTALMGPIAGGFVVFAEGQELGEGVSVDAPVLTARMTSVERTGDGLRVSLDDGTTQDVAVLFVVPTLHQSAPFAEQLGLELNPSGCVRIDEFARTSVPGVTAGGDLAHLAAFPMPMATVLMAAGGGQLAGHSAIARLLARGLR
ncbi:NAD(P)/FAD-dependent oxidoreductase [Knoellia sp. Soil729]|uniref:NAD(P)/FAD-dependent oxidoreductase n=1 Tax=Knoellia sp. Soil729 TaxID=1736394 RepID=UPI00070079F0|nr:NAD(P)/FAD-dependent oxidoreductase [Knoellia sp. Soil729]KRE40430.1 FAD-dependent oxidoreductase [Knoellia sp. Soil729]